jgi:hypothetical protein
MKIKKKPKMEEGYKEENGGAQKLTLNFVDKWRSLSRWTKGHGVCLFEFDAESDEVTI